MLQKIANALDLITAHLKAFVGVSTGDCNLVLHKNRFYLFQNPGFQPLLDVDDDDTAEYDE